MDFTEAVRRRRMVRAYDPHRPVERETVSRLLGLALRAPSAGHTQGWHFLVLDDITSREQFWTATADAEEPDGWLARMRTAPVLIVCLSDKDAYLDRYAEPDKGWVDRAETRWPVPYWHIDTGMAAVILLLAATDVGLGSCFFGVPSAQWPGLRTALAIPERMAPVGVVSLGYPANDLRSPSLKRGRRALDDVVSYGTFGTAG